MKKLRIGTIELESNCILAPMAGISDLPFRLLCAKQGVGMTCTEMVSAKAIYFNNKKTDALMDTHAEEGFVSLQLFGSDPQIMGDMAKQIEEREFAILDINMGCPVPKIVNNKEGSYLMKTPILAGKIIESVARDIKKPVTVKIRRGFDEAHLNE
jgi:tRNA-dihydrouridine synthase